MTKKELEKLVKDFNDQKIELEQLRAMVEYASQSNPQIKKWYEDLKNGRYH